MSKNINKNNKKKYNKKKKINKKKLNKEIYYILIGSLLFLMLIFICS